MSPSGCSWSAYSGRTSPGNVPADGTSAYAMGKLMGSFPDGFTAPDSTSAMAFPVSCPGCHARRMASAASRQLATSVTPATFITTTNGFPSARKASDSDRISASSRSVRSKSPATSRSPPSPEFRPRVYRPTSARAAASRIMAASTSISSIGGAGMRMLPGGRSASSASR